MSPLRQRFKNDISGIFWLAFAAFAALSLYSFNPNDPSFNSTGRGLAATNFCGYFGSFLGDLFYQGLGVTAWLLVVGTVRRAWCGFRGEAQELRSLSNLWAALLLVVSGSLLALYFPDTRLFDQQIQMSGLVGLMISRGLVAVFNPAGVAIILWSTAGILLIFYTEKSLQEIFRDSKGALRGAWKQGKSPSRTSRLSLQTLKQWVPRLGWASTTKTAKSKLSLQVAEQAADQATEPSSSERQVETGRKTPLFWLKEKVTNPKKLIAKPKLLLRTLEEATIAKKPAAEKEPELAAETFFSLPTADADTTTAAETEGATESEGAAAPTKKRRVRLSEPVLRRIANWELPKIELLEDPPNNRVRIDEKEIQRKAEILVDKLSQFSVTGDIVGVKTGPAVTMFEFKPNADVKISKITDLADDLSLALSAESVRIIAPIPGRNVVGIEMSNAQRESVYVKDIIAEKKFWHDSMKLPLALGRQADGATKVVDLRKMPHLLVAGTTGSGKSVFVVSILTGLIFRHSPKSLRLILIDPKQVDLAAFGRLPHLLMPPIREAKKAVSALRWAIHEMDKRYRSMSVFGARGLEGFNETIAGLGKEARREHEDINTEHEINNRRQESYYYTELPYIILVVEEFGDLMAVDKINVEQAVVRLAQMARACGIHLILAMQSPRKDVVTGLIKTNIPGRISFKVASKMDSRIILDDSGAERLLARGDMLFQAPGVAKPERHHGPWLAESEIDAVVSFWAKQGEPEFDELAMKALEGSGGGVDLSGDTEFLGDEGDQDERYDEVLAWVSGQQEVSASLLQRKFRLGYPRAARMIEIFETEGVVGPANGSKPRKVLITSYAET